MKTKRMIATIVSVSLLGLAAGCASTTPEDNNNTVLNNNNFVPPVDGGGTGCEATCTDPNYICVGIPGHQSCVPKCGTGMVCSDSTKACCYGGCVDLQNDPNNCGSCASYCNGTCVNSICVDQCGNSCGANEDCCGTTCVNTDTNVNFCGDCETQCDPSVANACTNGYCTCGGGAACTGGRQCCSTSCKDLTNDVTNCGQCGKTCAVGETCSNGVCSCNGATCTFGQGCCGGTCVNLTTDQYCGSCTNSCTDGNTCNNGQCNCAGEICAAGQFGEPAACCADGCVVYPTFGMPGQKNCGSCSVDCGMTELCICMMGMGCSCTPLGG